jgi:superfamily I DNA and/or RNA helicase
MPAPLDLDKFTALHLRLLDLERQAEIDEVLRLWAELPEAELERRGVTLRRLGVADTEVGLGGRLLVTLEPSRGGDLPAHRFAPGDVVALRPARDQGATSGDAGLDGVVTRVRSGALTIALDDEAEDLELPSLCRLDRIAPDVTFRRMRDALRALQQERRDDSRLLRETLLCRRPPETARHPATEALRCFDAGLDDSQREAVAFALRAQQIALIHGPPGTGKTTAVVEVIRQAVARGDKVLATAPSNVAVDNLVERLAAAGVAVVRIGHPARLLPTVRAHALDSLVEEVEDKRLAKDLRREISLLDRKILRATQRSERRDLRRAQKQLRAELRALDDANVRLVIERAAVVLSTTTGADDRSIRDCFFDLVVVDEAAQAIEAACWIPLHHGRRAVLAGDHRQLPPTIVSQEAERKGLGRTLFERIEEAFGAAATRMLTVQYRMHETIMLWSSTAMYGGRIRAAAQVAGHLLRDLPEVAETPDTTTPMLWIDTAGCGFDESRDLHDGSKSNEGEAEIVRRHVGNLVEAGVRPEEIGVITPYNAQVQLLRERLAEHEGLEVGTVDGFQGREKEAIVISLVRSNEDGEVGFLADARRLNVAVTRARRHVALVGDSATLANDAFLAVLVEYAQQQGEYRSAFEYGT